MAESYVAARPTAGDGRRGWWLFAVMLTTMAAGLTYLGVAPEHWLRGVVITSLGVLFGGLARLLIPSRLAGPLAVRSRRFDVACYLLGALTMLTFAFTLAVR